MNAPTIKTPQHFTYYPGNYRWSAEMLAILSTAPYGGTDISEVDRIGRSLRDKVGDDDAWFEAWREGGNLLRGRAQAAEAQGHRVTHVAHGLAALAEMATASFDAALLDLDLPGLDGLALARQLRAQGYDRPLIALTARADAEAVPQAMAAGFDRFMRKPVTGALLAELLDDAVA